MANFLKGLGYLTPSILIITGMVLFSINEPLIPIITRWFGIAFYIALLVVLICFGLVLLTWSLRNTFLYLFKININLKTKKQD